MKLKSFYRYIFVLLVSLFVFTGCGSDSGGGEFVAPDKIPITNTESEDNITILDSTVVMIAYSDIQQTLENNETTYSKSFILDNNKTEVKLSFDLLENNVTEDIQIDVEKLDYKEGELWAKIIKLSSSSPLENIEIEVLDNEKTENKLSYKITNSSSQQYIVSSIGEAPIALSYDSNLNGILYALKLNYENSQYILSAKLKSKIKTLHFQVLNSENKEIENKSIENIKDIKITFNELNQRYIVNLYIKNSLFLDTKIILFPLAFTTDFLGNSNAIIAKKTLSQTRITKDVLNNYTESDERKYPFLMEETVTHRITDFDKLLTETTIIPSKWKESSYGASPKGDNGRMPLILVHGWNGDITLFSRKTMRDPTKLLLWENAEYHYWHNFIAFYLTSEELQKKYHVYFYRYPSYKHIPYNGKIFASLLKEASSTNTDLGKGLSTSGITIMGHSMGGMVSRAMIEDSDGLGENAEKLKKLITLDTPHRGSVGTIDTFVATRPKDLDTHGAMDMNHDNVDGEFSSQDLNSLYIKRRIKNGLSNYDTIYCKKLYPSKTLNECLAKTANPYMRYLNNTIINKSYSKEKYILYTAWTTHNRIDTGKGIATYPLMDSYKNYLPKLNFIKNGDIATAAIYIGNIGYSSGSAESIGSSILSPNVLGGYLNPRNNTFPNFSNKLTPDLYHKDIFIENICTKREYLIDKPLVNSECQETSNSNISLITNSTGKDHPYGIPYRLFWDYDHETIFNGTAKSRGAWDTYITSTTDNGGSSNDTVFNSHRTDYVKGAMKIRYGQEPENISDDYVNSLNPLKYEPVFLTIEKDLLYSVTNGDIDEDKLPDIWEEENGLRWVDATDALKDSDKDGLTNLQEYNNGKNSTDPQNEDSDGDGFKDGVEVSEGTDPNDKADYPKSELTQPTNLTATATTNTITLKWDKVENASSYEICMAEEGIDIITKECTEQNGGKIFNSDSVEKKITDNLVVGTTYYFRVRGVNGNNGIWSDEVNATAVLAGLDEGAFANPEVNTEHNVKNVGLDITDGTLKLSLDGSNTETTFPFIWVANSGEGTISKLSTITGEELGRYKTGPGNGNPSRTTVDQDGNVWVGNRYNNTITKVGLKEWDQCIDRNENGVIDTSTGKDDVKGWTGSFGDGLGINNAEDECILQHVTLEKDGLSADEVRLVAIDPENNVFAGGYSSNSIFKVNGVTGEIIDAVQTQQNHYGGVVDKDGNLWSMNSGSGKVQKISNDMGSMELINLGHSGYGITIDKYGKVWTTEYGSRFSTFNPIDPVGTLQVFNQTDHSSAQGIAADSNGDIFIAGSLSGSTVGQYKQLFDENGIFTGVEFVKNYAVQSGPTGVAIDGTGKVWASNYYSNSVSRIDPVTEVVEHFSVGATPYNYSDMTGNIVRTITKRQGTWEATFDGKEVDYPWNKVSWKLKEALPQGTSIHVFAKVDNNEIGLNSKDYVEVSNGEVLSSLMGQYLKLKVELSSENLTSTPEVIEIQLY